MISSNFRARFFCFHFEIKFRILPQLIRSALCLAIYHHVKVLAVYDRHYPPPGLATQECTQPSTHDFTFQPQWNTQPTGFTCLANEMIPQAINLCCLLDTLQLLSLAFALHSLSVVLLSTFFYFVPSHIPFFAFLPSLLSEHELVAGHANIYVPTQTYLLRHNGQSQTRH